MAATKDKRYPLLVYRTIGRRWRPAALVLIITGALAILPRCVPEIVQDGRVLLDLRPTFITVDLLAGLGLLMLLVGLALYVGAVWRERRAFVQPRPDFLLVSTAGSRTAVSYMRINAIKPVQVGDVFPREQVRRGEWRFIKPYLGVNAILIDLDAYPLPEAILRRRWSQFLFSTQSAGLVLIVDEKKRNMLMNEIDALAARVQETAMRDGRPEGYLDPIDRLQYQERVR